MDKANAWFLLHQQKKYKKGTSFWSQVDHEATHKETSVDIYNDEGSLYRTSSEMPPNK